MGERGFGIGVVVIFLCIYTERSYSAVNGYIYGVHLRDTLYNKGPGSSDLAQL